jgi:hypothetical protein
MNTVTINSTTSFVAPTISLSQVISLSSFALGTAAGLTVLALLPARDGLYAAATVLFAIYLPIVLAGLSIVRGNPKSTLRHFIPVGLAFLGMLLPIAICLTT